MSTAEYEVWREERLRALELALDIQAVEIIHLDMFSRLNYKGLVRLARLFDKVGS